VAKPKVFVARRLPPKTAKIVSDNCDAEVWAGDNPPSRADIFAGVRGKRGILVLLTDLVDAQVMRAAPDLRVISNCAVGVDNIDLAEAAARRIPVGNTPDVLTDATADLTFALLLASARRIVEGVEYVKAGKWKTWDLQLLLGADLQGRTLGIIGYGRIGRAVARRATGFGLRVIFHDPIIPVGTEPGAMDLPQLLGESDFVSVHVPLKAATRHLIDDDCLHKMKPSAVLVNTSRGPVVDHDALYKALKQGWIASAALDVTEPEPLPSDSPLLELPNCIVVPHLGSASRWTREQMAILAAENLVEGVHGRRLPHCVNPEVYD
jgi:lactate dehydrogenase-like 2-hydroxyacid dehydrogenase